MNLIWLLKKGGKCKHIVDDGVCPLLSVAGLGLMGCWGIIIHYPTLSRPLLWLAHCGNTGLSLVGSDSPPLPAGDRIVWLTGHGRHMRTGGSSHRHIDNILTFFINFSCLLLSTLHIHHELNTGRTPHHWQELLIIFAVSRWWKELIFVRVFMNT